MRQTFVALVAIVAGFGCATPMVLLDYEASRVASANYVITIDSEGSYRVCLDVNGQLREYAGQADRVQMSFLLRLFEECKFNSMGTTYWQGYSDLPVVRLSFKGHEVVYSWLGGTLEEMLDVDPNAPLGDYDSFVILERLRLQIEHLVCLDDIVLH